MNSRLTRFVVGLAALAASSLTWAIDTWVVSDVSGGSRVMRFDSVTGEYKGSLGFGFAGTGFYAGEINPADGLLYVTKGGPGGVLRFDPITGEYRGGFANGFVDTPYDIKFGPDGLAYVFNYSAAGTASVMRFEPTTGEYRGAFGQGFLNTTFARMEFDSTGILHIDEYGSGRVTRFVPATGEYRGAYGTGFLPGDAGIAMDSTGKMICLGYNQSRITRFVPDTGEYRGTFASGFINFAIGICIAPGDIALVGTSMTNGVTTIGNSVMRFNTTTGEYLGHYGFGFLGTVWDVVPDVKRVYSGIVTPSGINMTGEQFTFTLKDITSGAVLDTVTAPVTDNLGNFSFSSYVRGNFRVVAKTRKRLSSATNVSGTNTGATGLVFTAFPGDSLEDNRVNLSDFSKLSTYYGRTNAGAGWTTLDAQGVAPTHADYNNDGRVNLSDFSLLSSNYGRIGTN